MDANERIRAARDLESQGRLPEAIAAYDAVIADGVGGAQPFLLKAALHKELDQLSPAVAALEHAEAIEPKAYEPKLRLAQIATSTGRDVSGIRHLQAAVRLDPDQYEVRVNLADIAVRADWLDTGYSAVAHLPPNLPDWWARARKTSIDRFEAMRAEVRSLLRQRKRDEPIDFDLAWALARHLYTLGRLRTAARLCDLIAQRAPDIFAPHDLKAKVLARSHGFDAALAYLRALPSHLQSSGDYHTRTARLLNELRRYDDVLHTLDTRPDIETSFDARYLRTIALLSLGRTDELRRHCGAWMRQSTNEVLPAAVLLGTVGIRTIEQRPQPAPSPFKIVQFWDKPDVPVDVMHVLNSWGDHHAVERSLYTEESAREFLRDHFGGDAVSIFDRCYHAAMKADYFRVAYLYAQGGLYVDADEHNMTPMTEILALAIDHEFAAVRSGDLMGYLHNYFLAAKPNSRVMEIALESADRDILIAEGEQRRPSIWHATGPGLLTRAASRYLAEDNRRETGLLLLPLQQWRYYVRNAGDLGYKLDGAANWQLS